MSTSTRSQSERPVTTSPTSEQTAQAGDAKFEISASRQFESWLAEQNASLAFTTYQAGRLFVLGLNPEGRLSVFNRTLERCMGMAYANGELYVATLYQILNSSMLLGIM